MAERYRIAQPPTAGRRVLVIEGQAPDPAGTLQTIPLSLFSAEQPDVTCPEVMIHTQQAQLGATMHRLAELYDAALGAPYDTLFKRLAAQFHWWTAHA